MTGLLLDTHVLIWWLAGGAEIKRIARDAIAAPQARIFVSAASAWEIAIKKALGKLDAPDDLPAQIARHRFTPLSITIDHGVAAGGLPRHHDDPFDRVLLAQARLEGLTLVTRDAWAKAYGIATMKA